MAIAYTCPHCGKKLDIPDQYAGQRGTCNGCGEAITVPSPMAPPDLPSVTFSSSPPPRPLPLPAPRKTKAKAWGDLTNQERGGVITCGCIGIMFFSCMGMGGLGALVGDDSGISTSGPSATRSEARLTSPVPVDNSIEGKIRRALGSSNRNVEKIETIRITKLPEGNRALVKWAIDDNLTRGFIISGAQGDVTEILQVFKESGERIDELHLRGTFAMVDKFGNSSESVVVKLAYTGSVVDRINFAGFDRGNAFEIADVQSVIHPEFR